MQTMIDLETFATDNNAFIISIGAVNFNKDGIINEFYRSINTDNNRGFSIDPATVKFWLHQDEDARKALFFQPVRLEKALTEFAEFLNLKLPPVTVNNHAFSIEETTGVWGNGATFDNVILRNAYDKCNIKCPWGFRLDKCYRTVLNLLSRDKQPEYVRQGTKHNALDDARTQALHLIEVFAILGLELN